MDQHEVILPDFYVHNNTFSSIEVLNPFGSPQFNKVTVIETLEEINTAVVLPSHPAPVQLSARVADMSADELSNLDINPALTNDYRQALHTLLKKYCDVFCWDPMKMGYNLGNYPDTGNA